MAKGDGTPGWLVRRDGMAGRIGAHDWAATALGPLEAWPPVLRQSVSLILDSPMPIALLWGAEGVMLYNDAYRLLLHGKPEALGRPFLEVWAEVRDALAPQVQAAFAGTACQAETAQFNLLRGEQQEEAFFDYALSPIRDEAGRVVGVLSLAIEITQRVIAERHRAEADRMLHEREARYRKLFETIDEGFCIMQALRDGTGRVVDVVYVEANRAWERQTGVELPTGKRASDLFGPAAEEWIEIWTRVADTGEAVRSEQLVPATNRWFDIHFSRLGGAGSGLIAAVFEDVSSRKLAEAALRERGERQTFLLRLSDALRAEPDADAVAMRALQMLSDELQLDRCYVGVYRLEEDRGELTHQVGNDRVPPVPASVRLSDFPEALKVAFDHTLVIKDIGTDPRLSDRDRQNVEALGCRALVVSTLRRGERRPVWSICAVSAAPRSWSASEIALIDEVTERTWSAIERARAEARVHVSEARFRRLAEANLIGVGFGTSKGAVLYANDEMLRMMGRSRAELEAGAVNWLDNILPEDRGQVDETLSLLKRHGAAAGHERSFIRPDGSLTRFISAAATVSAEEDLHVSLALDITERSIAEDRQTMLMAELDHRVKNILAVVLSIARQTLGRGESFGREVADLLVGRIHALARSHALLARNRWEGARLGDLVGDATAPYRGNGAGRITLGGPELLVAPKAAQTLALALHELATNAAKYGALSNGSGKVAVRWETEGEGADGTLVFSWVETDGPPIPGPPARRGFGSRMIEQSLQFELGGEVRYEFRPEGLAAEVRLPLDRLRARTTARAAERTAMPLPVVDAPSLAGRSILVAEDDYHIADMTAGGLRAAGCRVAGPCGSLNEALRLAVSEELDAAVLDINLAGDFVWPVARALAARCVPFVFLSGYSETLPLPRDLDGAPRLEKPVEQARIVAAVAAAVARRL